MIGLGLSLAVGYCAPSVPDGVATEPGDGHAPANAAEELLARSIAFHDPHGHWNSRPIDLSWRMTGPDAKDRVNLAITIDPRAESFRMNGHYAGTPFEYAVAGDEVHARVDGEIELDEAKRKTMALHREGGMFWRNYFGFLAGLPMNLRDPGAFIDAEPERTEFMAQSVDSIRVHFDPDVGTDEWTFYFRPTTSELLGCRFTKADPSEPGEYLVFDGLIEAGDLRLAKNRRWYTNDDDRYLGEDTITRLAVRD